jgi:two-component system chemotaxis response regulator CheB
VNGYAGFDVVLVAASQGGSGVWREIVAGLPPDFSAAIVYVQHRSPGSSTVAADLLRRRTDLKVRVGDDGDLLEPGTISVPPADVRVSVTAGRRLKLAPGHPGTELADGLFASAARAFGPRALAVVLSGRLHDGTAGVQAIKAHGGRVIAQDPATAEQSSMPFSALATGCVDLVLEPPRIAPALVALVTVRGALELFGVRGAPWAGSPAPR